MAATALPPLRTAEAAAEQAALANRAYAVLLQSGTSVTTAQYVAALAERGISETAARQRIKRDRNRGRLVTVSHEGEAVIPLFQLAEDFEHVEVAGDVVERLTEAGYSPWEVWDWAETPNGWIGRRTPAQVLGARDAEAIDRALQAAVSEGPAA
jgi:hypothetical protein